MSINGVLSNALSGLQASQAGMNATSNNISNVNTPGYARQAVDQSARALDGRGAGVSVDGVRRITDQYLTHASLQAKAGAAEEQVRFEILDRAQAAFGDPTDAGSLFSRIDEMFAGFAEAAGDPSSVVRRASSVSDVDLALAEFERIGEEIQTLRGETDARIAATVDRINALLEDVVDLNADVQRGAIAGDATGAENALAQVLDELSSLIDVRTIPKEGGAVEVRTTDGLLLAGQSATQLQYASVGSSAPGFAYPTIQAQIDGGPGFELDSRLGAGELKALIEMRDEALPELALQLGEFAGKTVDVLNQAHNDGTAYPPPSGLQGRNTGLTSTDGHNFTGLVRLAVLTPTGDYTDQIDVNFDTGDISRNGVVVAATGATMATLEAGLNTALNAAGAGGSATFASGRLALTAPNGHGVAIVPDAKGPPTPLEPDGAALPEAARAGRSFGHFFGLNDLVSTPKPAFFETGVAAGDQHRFTAGQTIEFKLTDAKGGHIADITYTVAGATFGDIEAGLDAAFSGFGDFSLDGNGAVGFSANAAYAGATLHVVDDQTARAESGMAFTDMFGVGDAARAGRSTGAVVRADIAADPARLAFGMVAQEDRSTGVGSWVALGPGDGVGAQGLQAANLERTTFAAAGALPAVTSTLTDYAARIASDAGRRASTAERTRDAAETLRAEADARRAGVEGVNIDEELVKLTAYQQSFNASARLIQAAQEMSETLLSLI